MVAFGGVIGRYYTESAPWWPERPAAPAGAPNVVMVVLDDVGFAQLGCFGSDIDTPVFDALGRDGVRFSNFHTTAVCSATRACLLTGRNHHANGMGRVIEVATGFPGYNARIPPETGLLSEMLVPAGYATVAVGKWHLTPDDECHAAATRERWPLGRGFERFYGFMSGETHQFAPAIVRDNHLVPPAEQLRPGYHLTEDLVDQAIACIKDVRVVDGAKPFFLYFCPGACHTPHHAPPEWIARYHGRFDDGWDAWRERAFARQLDAGVVRAGTELSPRPEWVPAWADLPHEVRRLYARYMEAFAGFLSHTDHHLGRLFEFLRCTGDWDNTLVFVLSDNGASSEGGPTGSLNILHGWNRYAFTVVDALAHLDEIGGPRWHNNYPWGWTVAGNTPFRRWKREVHEGGIADPLIVHWPRRGTFAGVRHQYVHAIDVVPTVLHAAGIAAPDEVRGVPQSALHGASFLRVLDDPAAPEYRATQYYEMFGCRALYHDGWKAVVSHPFVDTSQSFDDDAWELYHVAVDPSECHDLAIAHPEKVRELSDRWWAEAGRYQVLPLDNRPMSEFVVDRPLSVPPRARYTYYAGAAQVPEVVAPNVRNRSHTITAEVELPGEGVLLAQGSGLGGWCFSITGGRLTYTHNIGGIEQHDVVADVPLPHGRHALTFRFERTGEHRGTGLLLVDGVEAARAELPRFTPGRFSLTGAGVTCGYSGNLPVAMSTVPPSTFTGAIHRVVVQVEGDTFVDAAAEAEAAMASQ
jgi:arylsulfatase A-like enzyme